MIEDEDFTLADSNAILVYLALTPRPGAALAAGRCARTSCRTTLVGRAAGPLASGPAAARVAELFQRPKNPQPVEIARNLFGVVDSHLDGRDWLAAEHPTIADVAMYTYTAHAPEGGIALDPWPRMCAWVQRVEALPGFVAMTRSPLPDGGLNGHVRLSRR